MNLAAWLKREKLAASDLANWCRVARSVPYKWIAGKSIPRPEHMQTIARKTHNEVTPNDFLRIRKPRGE